MSDISQADLATISRSPLLRTDIAIEGGGGGCPPGQSCLPDDYIDPDDCPATPCDCEGEGIPYCFTADATALDTVVAGLTPHAYLKMADASGLPQDSSGNGNHASAISGATYSQTALTSKGGLGIRLTGAITLPPPVADPSNGAWSASFLAQWHDFDTLSTGNGFPGILCWCGASPPKFMLTTSFGAGADGYMSHLFDSQFGDIGHVSISPWPLVLEEVYALVIVTQSPGPSGVDVSQVWVNGTLWCSVYLEGDGVVGSSWDIGQNSGNAGPFFSSADWTISNYAQYAAALTYADVEALTEAMLDAAALASSPVFTT